MTRLAWTLVCLVAGATGGWAQVRVWGELGWQGQAVAGAVNPLAITVENGTGSVLSATLRAAQRVGSGWRGQAEQRLQAPLLLAPGGRARFVFPWPVEAGSEPVTVSVEAGGGELARTVLPTRLVVEKPVAVVGTVVTLPSSRPVLALAPEDLPEDPLLLSPFSQVQVAPTALVSSQARDVLLAWATFGGGSVTGLPMPAGVPPLRDGDLYDAVRRHGPRPPPVGLLVGGAALYLIALGYALPSLTRRGRPLGAAGLVALATCFALMYPVLYGSPQTQTVVQYGLTTSQLVRFGMDTLAVTAHRGSLWEGPGWWVERVPPGGEKAVRDVQWVWGRDGARTAVRIDPGQTVFLWRYGPAWVKGGAEQVVGPGRTVTRDDIGFAPLLAAVGSLLREGDRVFLDRAAERQGDLAWYGYRVRWERRG